MNYEEGMNFIYDLDKEPERADAPESRADNVRNMVIAAAQKIPKSKGFTSDFKAQMLKDFPELADESRVDDMLKYIYDRAQEARIGQTKFKVGGETVTISKKDIKETTPQKQRQWNIYRPNLNINVLLLILVLLAGLWMFRWEHILTQSPGSRTSYSWERDRWTGAVIALNIKNPSWPYTEKPSLRQYTVKNGAVPIKTATNIWFVLLGVDLALLMFCAVNGGNFNKGEDLAQ